MKFSKFSYYFLFVGIVLIVGCKKKYLPSSVFIIPDGHEGLVLIEYGLEEKPKIPFEDNHYIFNIPKNGLLQTSSKFVAGTSLPFKYYYLGNDNRLIPLDPHNSENKMIWNHTNGKFRCQGRKFQVEQFSKFQVYITLPSKGIDSEYLCQFIKERDPKSFY